MILLFFKEVYFTGSKVETTQIINKSQHVYF